MATFCKGLSVCHLVRPFEQGCKTAFGLPKSFQEFESGAVPESAWPDGGICKCARSQGKRCRNGKKRLQAGRNAQPLHDPSPSCTTWFLVGLSPRPMAHKTIALTTELKEPYMLGKASPLRPRQATGWRVATFCKGLSVCHLVRPFEQGCKTAFGLPKSFQEFESGAVPESAWPDGGICKCARSQGKRCRNGKKRLQAGRNAQPLHDPLPSCTTWFLVGLSPRPMAHKTIALTTELKEPYMLGHS